MRGGFTFQTGDDSRATTVTQYIFVVRNMSSILSTAKMIATPSSGKPSARKMIDIITNPFIGIKKV